MQLKFNYGKLIVTIIATAFTLYYAFIPREWHFIDSVNLIIHEAGHTIFAFGGDFLYTFGGTLLQIVAPIAFVVYFFLAGQRFSSALVLFWAGQNLINVSVYASDAIVMKLPLLSPFAEHDWNHVLSSLNLLKYTALIGDMFYFSGLIVILIASGLSFYLSIEK